MKEKKQNNYYVYEYIRLDTNEPFYVGKGKGNRWKVLNRGNNKHFNNIVKSVPIVVNILHSNLEEDVANDLEVWYIREYRDIIGYDLCNINDGGEGQTLCGELNPMYGKSSWDYMSEETRRKTKEKISKANKGENNPMYGKNHTKESRKKMGRTGKEHSGAKAVICLTTEKIFSTVKEGSKYYEIKGNSIVNECCAGKHKFAGKLTDGTLLKWMYLSDFLEKCKYILL